MSHFRRCSRPGCGKPAVATLTYTYAESTAVVGPLAATNEPHSWDLCQEHAAQITAPLGWEMLRVDGVDQPCEDEERLTALAEAVREVGRHSSGLVPPSPLAESGRTTRADEAERIRLSQTSAHPARARSHRPPGAISRGHLYLVPDLEEG